MVVRKKNSDAGAGDLERRLKNSRQPFFSGLNMSTKVIQNPKMNKSDKLKQLYEYLTSIRNEIFTGYIKINFTQGNIGRVEKFEEILMK